MIYLRLFYEFFKTGLFAVGGGLATLPFLQIIGEKTGWYSTAELADMIAVSESTPGPIGVNMANYAGFTSAGISGALVAVLGLITPSVIVIMIVSGFLKRFKDSPAVNAAFGGIRPASVALITAVFFSLVTMNIVTLSRYEAGGKFLDLIAWPNLILAVLVFLGTKKFKKIHPAFFLLIGAVAGVVFKM